MIFLMAIVRATPGMDPTQANYGSMQLVETRYGLVLRRRGRYRPPSKALPREVVQRLSWADQGWKLLTPVQMRAWDDFAAAQAPVHLPDGRRQHRSGHSLFCSFADQLLEGCPAAAARAA